MVGWSKYWMYLQSPVCVGLKMRCGQVCWWQIAFGSALSSPWQTDTTTALLRPLHWSACQSHAPSFPHSWTRHCYQYTSVSVLSCRPRLTTIHIWAHLALATHNKAGLGQSVMFAREVTQDADSDGVWQTREFIIIWQEWSGEVAEGMVWARRTGRRRWLVESRQASGGDGGGPR